MSKQAYIKDEHIEKIEVFLRKAYNATKGGYAKVSMSKIARESGVTVKVSDTLFAVKNLAILKQRGERRASMWHWVGTNPTTVTAEKVYNEVRRIIVNKNLKKTVVVNAKLKNLTPIIGSSRPGKVITSNKLTKNRVLEILNDMIKNMGNLFTIDALVVEYKVDARFFNPLHELDFIQPYDRIPSSEFFKLSEIPVAAKDTLVDLIMESYDISKEPKQKQTEKSVDERTSELLVLLKFIESKNLYKGSMSKILKEYKLAAIYQTIATKLGYLKNLGSSHKPIYTLTVPANTRMSQDIVNGVRDYWSNGTIPTSVVKHGKTEIITKPVVSIQPESSDLNAMLERAKKRKTYLMIEMEKVDKIIENANTIMKLTAELLN